MKKAKTYENVVNRFYRTDIHKCPTCQSTLKKVRTISSKTIVTLDEIIKMTHAGYSCVNLRCPLRNLVYRSVAADALALPQMVFGLDIVLLVGHLHLSKHQTIDEIHEELLERLQPLGTSVSRREILYLFEHFCAVLRAASDAKQDMSWKEQVARNGGIIISIDGIQPDKGNETIYLVRDALTGRMLAAENAVESTTERLIQILEPVKQLDVNVLGTISDAQEAEIQALAHHWPDIPRQLCQFHLLRDAGKPSFEQDRAVKTDMRAEIGKKLRNFRSGLRQQLTQADGGESQQLAIIDQYAASVQTALNQDGVAPFTYAAIENYEKLDEIAASVDSLQKKGKPASKRCERRLHRLQKILAERERWQESVQRLRRMRQWVYDAEQLLSGAEPAETDHVAFSPPQANLSKKQKRMLKEQSKKNPQLTNEIMAARWDRFITELRQILSNEIGDEKERKCLQQFLDVFARARPYLLQCYDLPDFPRTNNDTEGAIRKMKTRYRRISGRKNWNQYLLRHGRYVAFYDWWDRDPKRWQQLTAAAQRLDPTCWSQQRASAISARSGQLARFRLRANTTKYLASLEKQWEAVSQNTSSTAETQTTILP